MTSCCRDVVCRDGKLVNADELKQVEDKSGNADKYKPVTHVIFDMDGTLIDSETVFERIYMSIAQEHGKEYTPAINLKRMGRQEYDAIEILRTELDISAPHEELLELYYAKCNELLQHIDLMPGVDKLVRHLAKHNIPIAIATSGNEWLSKIKTQNYTDLFSLFHHTVYGSTDPEVKNGKPAPDIYLICAARFPDSPKPEQVLVFEDAPNGVEGSIRAGMQVIMLPSPEVTADLKKKATLVLNSMTEFQPEWFGLPPYDN